MNQITGASTQNTAPVYIPRADPAAKAAQILRNSDGPGGVNLQEVKRDLTQLRMQNADFASQVEAIVRQNLSTVERAQLDRAVFSVEAPDGRGITINPDAMPVGEKFNQPAGSAERETYNRFDNIWGDGNPATNDTQAITAGIRDMIASGQTLAQVEAAGAQPANDGGPDGATLALDLGQIALDIVGIFEPTPFADGTNTVISIFRGNWGDAGLSALGMFPYLGDAAKLGKMGKWAQTVANAVELAAGNPAMRRALEPALQRIHDAVNAIPQGAMDKLPASAREALQSMKTKLDELFAASGQAVTRLADDFIASMPAVLSRTPTSGVAITADANRTTTVLGNYGADMQHVISELNYPKNTDFGAKTGGYNILNVPDEMYKTPDQFWTEVNKPFLDAAISRGDNVQMATRPTNDVLNRTNPDTGAIERSGFGREYDYLVENGYRYDSQTSTMIKP